MKTKKIFIPVFTLSAALLLTACSGKEAADTTKTQTTQTEAGTEAGTESGTKSGTETTGTSGTKLDDLYQQENQIFADHEEVWNKVFGMMNKSTADPSGNYADYLAEHSYRKRSHFSTVTYLPYLPSLLVFRIQNIPERISQHIKDYNYNKNCQPGENHHPWCRLNTCSSFV